MCYLRLGLVSIGIFVNKNQFVCNIISKGLEWCVAGTPSSFISFKFKLSTSNHTPPPLLTPPHVAFCTAEFKSLLFFLTNSYVANVNYLSKLFSTRNETFFNKSAGSSRDLWYFRDQYCASESLFYFLVFSPFKSLIL